MNSPFVTSRRIQRTLQAFGLKHRDVVCTSYPATDSRTWKFTTDRGVNATLTETAFGVLRTEYYLDGLWPTICNTDPRAD